MAVAAVVAMTTAVCAVPPKISAKLEKPGIIMGEKTVMQVQIVADRGAVGRFPIFDGVSRDSVATLLGDTIELSADFSMSTIDLGSGRSQTDYKIPVQAFDSGYYSLPPIAYVIGQDTLFTSAMPLKVVPVNAAKDDKISDFTPVLQPQKGPFYDALPLWLLDWWWLIVSAIVLAAAIFGFFITYKRIVVKRKKRLQPPYEEAVASLGELNDKKLWQKGEQKEYFSVLTNILRRYISRRFDFHAEEMTSAEIIAGIKNHELLKPYLEQFEAVLAVADFAKFANMQCTPAENEGSFNVVREFVEKTKPTEEERRAELEKQKKIEPEKKAQWVKRSKAKKSSVKKHRSGNGKEVKK